MISVRVSNTTQNISISNVQQNGSDSQLLPVTVGVELGLEAPSGRIGIIALPGIIAIVSLFFVNTVELYHLQDDGGLTECNKLFLKVLPATVVIV